MIKATRKGRTKRATTVDDSIANSSATVAPTGERDCESARPSNPQSTGARDEAIRALAFSKWEAAGRPAGDGFEFWLEAEREVDAEVARTSPAQA